MAVGTTTALIAAGIAAAGTATAGIAGAVANMSAQDRAKLLQEQGVQQWLKVNIPDPKEQQLALDKFVRTGTFTPELEKAVKPLDTEFKKIQQDPRLKESRMRALAALEQQGYGGEQVQDTAARQQALIDAGAKNRGEQEAITSSMARRGQLGTGLELAARQAASQSNQDRLANSALEIEKQRRNRALQSITGAGDLAGNIQNADFQRNAAIAQAQDAINMFNTQNTQGVQQRNVNRANEASQYNLGMDQDIANRNVGLNNFQQQYNKELLQQQFQNQAAKAAGLTGQYNNQAQNAIEGGKNAGNMWAGIAGGLSSVGANFAKDATKVEGAVPQPLKFAGDDETDKYGAYA